jgi:hypothetical protein
MVGGTTVGDSQSNCELKVMKQTGNGKSNPKPKGKTFLLREERMEFGWRVGKSFQRYAFVRFARHLTAPSQS